MAARAESRFSSAAMSYSTAVSSTAQLSGRAVCSAVGSSVVPGFSGFPG